VDLIFDGVGRPVRLAATATDLIPLMRRVLDTWPFREAADEQGDPVIELWRHDGGYARRSPWLDEPKTYPDALNAVCDFFVDLVHAYAGAHPDMLCLHCAALDIGGRIVVFPSGYNQGKSTLMVLAAAHGLRIFCDDVMPLNARNPAAPEGRALGIQPRLRMPIPEALGDECLTFVNDHAGPGNDRFQYLDLGPTHLAPYGETLPLGAIVVLERNETGENAIEPASPAEALMSIILRNFSQSVPAPSVLDQLHGLVESTQTFRLTYSDGERATRLLRQTFDRAFAEEID